MPTSLEQARRLMELSRNVSDAEQAMTLRAQARRLLAAAIPEVLDAEAPPQQSAAVAVRPKKSA